ncbi:MAG: hypothetical protein H6R01_1423 [Burkholderiaceae bacterium]|nr:hypothetical protein [Burkholderiaceae bacterium]
MKEIALTVSIGGAEAMPLVCDDPASGQSLSFVQADGRQIVSYRESAAAGDVVLTDSETAEIAAWRNGGRRNSYWNWPGLEAVRERGRRPV